jgi:hypothetical protein
MMKYALLLIAFLAAPAYAQTALSWDDGTGGCRVAASDKNGTAYPASATLSCRVRIPSISWSITLTGIAPGGTRTFTPPFSPSASVLQYDAFAESDVSLVPGVWGATTPATPVLLRPQFAEPGAPALLP